MHAFRKSMISLLLALPVALACTATASAEEEQENYYLEQMRKQSQSGEKEPAIEMPADEPDFMAGSDTDSAAHYEKDFSDIGDIKPDFEKPKLDPYEVEQ